MATEKLTGGYKNQQGREKDSVRAKTSHRYLLGLTGHFYLAKIKSSVKRHRIFSGHCDFF